jgi:hypothetical protein
MASVYDVQNAVGEALKTPNPPPLSYPELKIRPEVVAGEAVAVPDGAAAAKRV